MNYDQPNAVIIKKIFNTIGLYTTWVNLELVVGAEWLFLLNRLLEVQLQDDSIALIRSGIYAYLCGIVNKGMSTVDKLHLITNIWDQLGSKLFNDPLLNFFLNHTEMEDLSECQLDSICGFAKFVESTGIQLITIYR